MDEQTLRVLEFDQVLQAAASLAETPLGAARVLALTPVTEEDSVRLELDRVAEVLRFLELEEGLDLGGLHDLASFGERLSAEGGYLLPEELALFGQTLICLGRLKRRLGAAGREYPLLGRMAGRLAERPDLIAALDRTLGPGLTIADEASPELASLRRRSQRTKGQVRSRLEELLGRHRSRGLWQDEIITQRSGRFVLPLKSERQGGLEGIIHDYSASGQTAFLEPVEVVGLNNELGRLSAQERREIERILTRLTDRLRAIGPELFDEVAAAAEVDSLQARARLASRLEAIRPELDEGGRLD
ncbi:MAG: endonuclease MutS2, partial [Deltaproteobacteria bacterium]|nr:endonuclease MutS2 [Deltaproteobacteria bacterium]